MSVMGPVNSHITANTWTLILLCCPGGLISRQLTALMTQTYCSLLPLGGDYTV